MIKTNKFTTIHHQKSLLNPPSALTTLMVTLPPNYPPHMEVNASHSLGGGCDQSSGADAAEYADWRTPNMTRLLQCMNI